MPAPPDGSIQLAPSLDSAAALRPWGPARGPARGPAQLRAIRRRCRPFGSLTMRSVDLSQLLLDNSP